MRWVCLGLVTAVCSVGFAQADNNERAEAMVKEAVAFAKAQGKGKLIEATNLPSGQFHLKKGDTLYLFAYDLSGICVAHGFKAELVGMNRYDAKDINGKYYVREFLDTAKTKGSGWIDYHFLDPKTGKAEWKVTFVTRHEDLIICAGAYQE